LKTSLLLALILGPALLSTSLHATAASPSDVTKVYISPAADLTIVEHPDDADTNYGDMDKLDVGYIWLQMEYCDESGVCLSYLAEWDVITLLKYDLPDVSPDVEVKKVYMIIPATFLYYFLPEDDFPNLCKFTVGKFDHIFFEDQTTWNSWMNDPGAKWNPRDYVIPLAAFYASPNTGTPIVIDLTDELKDRVEQGGDLYMALAPMLDWADYEWAPGMTCQLFMTSSEVNGGPVLYVEVGPPEYVPGTELPEIPFLPGPTIPPDIAELISGVSGEEEGEPVPLPNIPWDQLTEIPKIIIPQVPLPPSSTPIPALTPPKTIPPPPTYPPTFSVDMTPLLQSVQAGGSVTFKVQVTPHFGFSDWVTLKAYGGPADCLMTLTPDAINPVAATKPEATLTVQVPEWTPPGNYLVTVVGESGGLMDSASAWIMVQAPPSSGQPGQPPQQPPQTQPPAGASGDFYIAVSPKEQSTSQGAAATYEVFVHAIGGFQEEVELFLVSPPQGSKFVIHGSPLSPGEKAYVRVLPTEGTPPGTYDLIIAGVGGDIQRSTTAHLQVLAKTSGAGATTPPPSETHPPTGAAAIDLVVGDDTITAPVGERRRTWAYVRVTQGQVSQATIEVVDAPPGVHWELSSGQAAPNQRVLIYLWADEPGEYEVRIRASAGQAADEEVIRLIASGAAPGETEQPGCTEPGCGRMGAPQTRPPPSEGGETTPLGLKLWPDLVVALLAALVVILTLLLLIVGRRGRSEGEEKEVPEGGGGG